MNGMVRAIVTLWLCQRLGSPDEGYSLIIISTDDVTVEQTERNRPHRDS
jgi:hypothetical protein